MKYFLKIIMITLLLSGCSITNTEEREEVIQKFDGHNWSWNCWEEEINFTLWREYMTKVEKQGNYWIIKGTSSDRDNTEKRISTDESGRILIIYDKENDKITDWTHGEDVPMNPIVNEEGKITNEEGVVYC
jgi:hypothetical protein